MITKINDFKKFLNESFNNSNVDMKQLEMDLKEMKQKYPDMKVSYTFAKDKSGKGYVFTVKDNEGKNVHCTVNEALTTDSKNDIVSAINFTSDELIQIEHLVTDFSTDLSGVVTFANKYALIKFKSGRIEMLVYNGTDFTNDTHKTYNDYKEYNSFDELLQTLTDKSYEESVQTTEKMLFLEKIKIKLQTKINEGSAEGEVIENYDEWKNALQDKYPKVEFVDNGDTEGAYEGEEVVGYWDLILLSGIVYDMNLMPKNENTTSSKFNLEGLKENLKPYLNSPLMQFVDLDMHENMYYVCIPFYAIKNEDVAVANKIVRIAELYPKCKSAFVEWPKEEIRLVFNNF